MYLPILVVHLFAINLYMGQFHHVCVEIILHLSKQHVPYIKANVYNVLQKVTLLNFIPNPQCCCQIYLLSKTFYNRPQS